MSVMLSLLNCIAETIQVTEDFKYSPRWKHVGQPRPRRSLTWKHIALKTQDIRPYIYVMYYSNSPVKVKIQLLLRWPKHYAMMAYEYCAYI